MQYIIQNIPKLTNNNFYAKHGKSIHTQVAVVAAEAAAAVAVVVFFFFFFLRPVNQ